MDPRNWLCTLLAPSFCLLCGLPVPEFLNGSVCSGCWVGLAPIRVDCVRCGQEFSGVSIQTCRQCRRLSWIEDARAFGRYRGPLGTIIRRYKYAGEQSLAPGLVRLLETAFDRLPGRERWDYIVPVASHRHRRRERGFDHVELMGRLFSRRTGIRLRRALRRQGPNRPQAGLTQRQRRLNVRGAFAARARVEGSVLLVDDIFTTGATVNECAHVLRKAGAARVAVLTLARAD